MAREDKEKKSKIRKKSDCIETAEYSCSLELETHSFLIVHADVRHNVGGWGLYDCVHVGNCPVVDWEAGNCAMGGLELSGGLGGWGLSGCGKGAWEAGDCLVVQ